MENQKQTAMIIGYIPLVDHHQELLGRAFPIEKEPQKEPQTDTNQNPILKIVDHYVALSQKRMPKVVGLLWMIKHDQSQTNDYTDLEEETRAIILVEERAKELRAHMDNWARNYAPDGKLPKTLPDNHFYASNYNRFKWFIHRDHNNYTKESPYSLGIISDPKKSMERFLETQDLVTKMKARNGEEENQPMVQKNDDSVSVSVPITSHQTSDTSVLLVGPEGAKYIYEKLNTLHVAFLDLKDVTDKNQKYDRKKSIRKTRKIKWMRLERLPMTPKRMELNQDNPPYRFHPGN